MCEQPDEEIERRLTAGDIHPSGPLWGKGELPTHGVTRALEEWAVAGQLLFTEGLAKADLRQERRALRLPVTDLNWEWSAQADLRLRFSLPSGSYATAVLRELVSSRAADVL
jgi:tRNA pseudouridine13 synthase